MMDLLISMLLGGLAKSRLIQRCGFGAEGGFEPQIPTGQSPHGRAKI